MRKRNAWVSHPVAQRWLASPYSISYVMLAYLGLLLPGQCSALADEEPDQPKDRRQAEENHWVYNDLAKGFAEAKRTGKPLFVVIRCPP
jgi:serine protease Do